MRRILHICAGWQETNGAAVIARLIAGEQSDGGDRTALRTWAGIGAIRAADEVWIHCGWKPCLWWATLWAVRLRKPVVWVPEACYDPIRLAYHGWKKRLVGPIERFCLRRVSRIVATCEAERGWVKSYLGLTDDALPRVEVSDIRRFFAFRLPVRTGAARRRPLHLLYLGRRHPLKGLDVLEAAMRRIGKGMCELRIESGLHGAAKEAAWEWCDCLVLPTLSDNFGLVVAEALAHGRSVITTDGAPAWSDQEGVTYLEGYRTGTPERRVALLAQAIEEACKAQVG